MILQGKVALVTGGTSEIGRATAIRPWRLRFAIAFGAAGAKVVFSGRRDTEGEKTAKLIRDIMSAESLMIKAGSKNMTYAETDHDSQACKYF